MWRRRAALLRTVALNQPASRGVYDVPRTLLICDFPVGDRHDMLIKAMSWALRALAVKWPAAVAHELQNEGMRWPRG